MKRPSNFNLMSHRQVINCPTALELCSLATEGTQEMKEIKEMAIAYQSSAWNNFCTFCYFCGTSREYLSTSMQPIRDYYANPIRSPEILLKIRTG